MPDVTIEVGSRTFVVACQDGEERFLKAAAEMLDREARVLVEAGGRLTQDRMLLMAGLMLADKTLSAEEEMRVLERQLAEQDDLIKDLEGRPDPEPQRIEVEVLREIEREVVPEEVVARAEAAARRAGEIADRAARLARERGAAAERG